MGSRGPLERSKGVSQAEADRQRLLGKPSHHKFVVLPSVPDITPVRRTLHPCPRGLAKAGKATWTAAWSCPWVHVEQHADAVRELAMLADEIDVYRALIGQHGPLLEEPIVSPTGAVLGTRLVPNPAEAMARRAGRAASDLRAALGLTPAAKGRLGLVAIEAESMASRLRRSEGSRPDAG